MLMGNRVLVLALFALVAAAPLPAGAVESARPLRSLSFELDLNVATLVETSGGNVPLGGQAAIVTKGRVVGHLSPQTRGSGDSAVKRRFSTKGSITVDVVRATDDSGLIVDVAENATDRVRPKVRLGIAVDGSLLFDPATRDNVTEEELALVRWLARGFYGDRPTDPGTAWTVDQSSNGHTDLEHYRVVERDEHRVTLEYTLDEKVTGVTGFEATRAGSLVYDTTLVVPVKATFQTDTRRQVAGSYDTVRTTVALTLLTDSFAPRR
jgi:hypothetical protein